MLDTNERPLMTIAPSARPGVLTLIEGADGATLFPLLRVHRSLDGGATWEAFELRSDPQAYMGTATVLADGRLLVDIQAWSDQRANQPSAQSIGLHVSDGARWSDLSAVDVGHPFASGDDVDAAFVPHVVGMQVSSEAVAVLAQRRTGGVATSNLFVSRDGGRSWNKMRAR